MPKSEKFRCTVVPYGRWVLITGCDSGFGFLTTQQLLKQGYGVIAICLTDKGCQTLSTAVPPSDHARLYTIQCDITKDGDLEKVRTTLETWHTTHQGMLWAVINNAGIAIPGYIDYLTEEDFRKVMEVNFFGTLRITQLVLPWIKAANGRIINICSTCALVALPGNGPYNASKFAIRALNDTLRRELSKWKVNVIMIAPGVMRTSITTNYLSILEEKFGTATESVKAEYGDRYSQKILHTTNAQIQRMAQDPQLVANTMVKAVTSRHPKALYLAGFDAKFLFNRLSKCPARYADKFLNIGGRTKPAVMNQRGTKVMEFTQICSQDRETTWQIFLDAIWKNGAGYTPKMYLEEEGDATGNGCTRWIPLVGKKGIREGITATNYPQRMEYRVKNPSWTSFPVNFHRGFIEYLEHSQTQTQVVWRIELTPKPGMLLAVVGMIRVIIPIYLKTLAQKCEDKNSSN